MIKGGIISPRSRIHGILKGRISLGYFHLCFSFGNFLALLPSPGLKSPGLSCAILSLSGYHTTGLLFLSKLCPTPGSTLDLLAKLLGHIKIWPLHNQLSQNLPKFLNWLFCAAISKLWIFLSLLAFFHQNILSEYHSFKPPSLLRQKAYLRTVGARHTFKHYGRV